MKLRVAQLHIGAVLILSLIISTATTLMTRAGVFDGLELAGFDALVHTSGPLRSSDRLVIIDFDNASVQSIGKYPVPREILADLLNRVSNDRPAVIALDKFLSDPTSVGADRKLVDSFAHIDNLVLADAFATSQVNASEPLPAFRGDRAVGFVNLAQDNDGFIRRMFVFVRTPEFSGLSFPVAVASNYLGQPLTRSGPLRYKLGGTVIPVDSSGLNTSLLGAWNLDFANCRLSAARVLSGDFTPGRFREKIVLIGESSSAGKDLYTTPLFRFRNPGGGRTQLSGVEIHAVAIESLLRGRLIRPLPILRQWVVSFCFVIIAWALMLWLPPVYGVAATLLVEATAFGVAVALFDYCQLWLRFASVEQAVGLSLLAGLGYRFVQERWLKSAAQREQEHESRERQKLEDEMIQARQIQESLLPASLPKIAGLEIAAHYQPSLYVGGDYYDFLQPNPGTLVVLIADVQGHGVSAALLMSNLQAHFREVVRTCPHYTPAQMVAWLNDRIVEGGGERLVTLFLGSLDVWSWELLYVNAGHTWPMLFHAGEPQPSKLEEGGMLLGVLPAAAYKCGRSVLKPGDVLLLMTDGLTEASNASGEEYSWERVTAIARDVLRRSAREIVDAVFRNVMEFADSSQHDDDKIVVALKALPRP